MFFAIFALIFIFSFIYFSIHIFWMLPEKVKSYGIVLPKLLSCGLAVVFLSLVLYVRSFSMGIMFYMLMLFLISDILRVFIKYVLKIKSKLLSTIYMKGFSIVILSVVLVIYGAVNAGVINTVEYTVDLKKPSEEIKIAFVSDMHIGTSIKKDEMDEIIETVNRAKPDIICLGGDIYDESTSSELFEYSIEAFSRLSAKYGVYYVTGNHDSGIKNVWDIADRLEQANVKTLNDKAELIENSFYIAGRNDSSINAIFYPEDERLKDWVRKDIAEVLMGVNKELPIILLDHKPTDILEAKEAGVDLQLSGHTHAGQIFPFNFIVSIFNNIVYGMESDGDFTCIVSSGAGVWGFPVRVGTSSEIVFVNVN